MQNESFLRGILFAILGFFMMAVFGIFVKLACQTGSVLWVSFLCYIVGTLLLIPYLCRKGLHALKTEKFKYHLGRIVFGLTASLLYTLSLNYIPMVNATLLFNTTPLFIPLLSIYMMNTHISTPTWWAILLGFIGVIILIKPTVEIFHQSGDLIGLASGMSLAVAYVFVKMLAATDPLQRIVFYYFFGGAILQLPLLYFAGPFPPMDAVGYSIAAGASLLVAQMSLVKAYSLADAADVGIFQFTSVIFVGFIDWLIWSQVPPVRDWLGIALVILAGIVIIRNSASHTIPRKT